MCTGTEDGSQKGGTPKGRIPCRFGPWAYGEQSYDCHLYQMKRYPDRDGLTAISICLYFGEACIGTPLSYVHKLIINTTRRKIMSVFTGAGVAIVTPMTETGEVNYPKLEEILEYQIANGTDSIIICGTTGEASTLTHEEHLEAIRFTIEKVGGRIPVIAGTGSNCTDTAIYLSTEAEKYGADALLLVTPYYNKATQKGLIAHFTKIANSVKIPVILYNVPGRTGVNITPETAAYLAKNVENIVGIKEASGNISQIAKLAHLVGDSMDLYSGNDDQIVPLLSLGGKGVISVLSNIAPQETHDIVAKFMAGDVKGSCELQLKALPLVDALFCEVNPIPVKTAMNMLGWEVGPLRMPLSPMEEAHMAQLKAEMDAFGIKAKGEN